MHTREANINDQNKEQNQKNMRKRDNQVSSPPGFQPERGETRGTGAASMHVVLWEVTGVSSVFLANPSLSPFLVVAQDNRSFQNSQTEKSQLLPGFLNHSFHWGSRKAGVSLPPPP